MRDTLTIGMIGGLVGTTVFTVVDWALSVIGIQFTPAWVAAGNILLNTDVLYTPAGILLGFIIQFMLGGGFGAIIAIVLRLAGKDYYLLKGLGVSSLFLIGATGITQAVANIIPWMRSELMSTIVATVNFAILGLVSSWVVAKYAVFNEASQVSQSSNVPSRSMLQPAAAKPLENTKQDKED